MKQIIKPKKTSKVVSLNDLYLEDKNVIGFKHESGRVGVVTRENFCEGTFRVLSLSEQSFDGNVWDYGDHDTLEGLIEELMSCGKFFLFKDIREFSYWIVNNC